MGFVGPGVGTHFDIKAIQAAGFINSDVSNLLTFLPPSIKITFFFGASYHIGWSIPYEGIGIVSGGNFDYWFDGKPIGIRLYGHGHIIPGPGTTATDPSDDLGAFGSIGFSLLTSFALTSR